MLLGIDEEGDDISADNAASDYASTHSTDLVQSRRVSLDWSSSLEQMIEAYRNQTLSYISGSISFVKTPDADSLGSCRVVPTACEISEDLSETQTPEAPKASQLLATIQPVDDWPLSTSASVSSNVALPQSRAHADVATSSEASEASKASQNSPSRRPPLPPRLSVPQLLATHARSFSNVLKMSAIWRHSEAMNLVVIALSGFKYELDDLREV